MSLIWQMAIKDSSLYKSKTQKFTIKFQWENVYHSKPTLHFDSQSLFESSKELSLLFSFLTNALYDFDFLRILQIKRKENQPLPLTEFTPSLGCSIRNTDSKSCNDDGPK